MKEYDRLTQWHDFDWQVRQHILEYTLPQYGSHEGAEQVDGFTIEDCFVAMQRYINRRHANVRGDVERLRDLVKIAHYAQFAYDKLKRQLAAEDVYDRKL